MPTRNTPLKHGYDKAYLGRIATAIGASSPAFNESLFLAAVQAKPWKDLELKDRMKRISSCLDEALPTDFAAALKILDPAVAQFESFLAMFFPDFVERRVTHDFARNWELGELALARYTAHSSSEFAVRPMILEDQERMLKTMLHWTADPCEHVRRLASEGSRPRLPWAMALPPLKVDPAPLLPILEALRDDTSEYVRRSVANNLNDIAKDHVEVVLDTAERWLREVPVQSSISDRRRLVKHACRTLLKAGNPRAMVLFGFMDPAQLEVTDLIFDRRSLLMGESLEFTFEVRGQAPLGKLRIEYAVFYQKANGSLSPKVFKISEFECAEKQRTMTRRHTFRDLSTRRHHPGRHEIEVRINGVPKARLDFELQAK
jgi:3-methyladenine DNA glycosylase AlkC